MVHNVKFSCSHISFVWLHGLNSLQWWLLTCPDLTKVVWFKNNIDQHEYPKQLQAHPAKKRWNTRYPKYPMILKKNCVRIGYCQKLSGRVGYKIPVRHWIRHSGRYVEYYSVKKSTTQWRKVRLSEEKSNPVKKSTTQWGKVRPSALQDKGDESLCSAPPVLPAATVSGDKNEMMTFLVQPPVICFSTQTKVPENKIRSCTSIVFWYCANCHWCPFFWCQKYQSVKWQFCSCTTLWALFETCPQIQLL